MEINIGLNDILFVSPMIALFLASLIPITVKIFKGNREQHPAGTLAQGLGGILVAASLLIIFSAKQQSVFYNALAFDGLTLWMSLIALIGAAGGMLLAYENPATNGRQFSEFTFLILNSALGMLLLIASLDLLMVFIGIEMMSLALYLLIAMSHEEKLAKEAAFKYFLLGSMASAIMLYGIAFIFGSAGTTYISDLLVKMPELIGTSRLFVFGIALVVIGFAFKVSIAPFHAWTPDVYQGAPTPLSSYMATGVKVASFAALLRFTLTGVLMGSENLFDILQWLAAITMLVGNVAAILQENVKRMLAYSSIAHSGYLMVGLIAAGISKEPAIGSSSVMFYLLSYTIMTIAAFAFVSLFEASENTILNIGDLSGFAKTHPIQALSLTVVLLSLAGIPPTIGFFGKFYMFTAAIGEGLLWLALWGFLNSVISAYYYLRPIVVMYMKEGSIEEFDRPLNATKMTVVTSAVLIIGLGLVSSFILRAITAALV